MCSRLLEQYDGNKEKYMGGVPVVNFHDDADELEVFLHALHDRS